jgi:hypothetical protein
MSYHKNENLGHNNSIRIRSLITLLIGEREVVAEGNFMGGSK